MFRSSRYVLGQASHGRGTGGATVRSRSGRAGTLRRAFEHTASCSSVRDPRSRRLNSKRGCSNLRVERDASCTRARRMVCRAPARLMRVVPDADEAIATGLGGLETLKERPRGSSAHRSKLAGWMRSRSTRRFGAPLRIQGDEIEDLARLEHDRWCVERRAQGSGSGRSATCPSHHPYLVRGRACRGRTRPSTEHRAHVPRTSKVVPVVRVVPSDNGADSTTVSRRFRHSAASAVGRARCGDRFVSSSARHGERTWRLSRTRSQLAPSPHLCASTHVRGH